MYILFALTGKSLRETRGTFILWVDGHISSYFLPVNISMATKCTCKRNNNQLINFTEQIMQTTKKIYQFISVFFIKYFKGTHLYILFKMMSNIMQVTKKTIGCHGNQMSARNRILTSIFFAQFWLGFIQETSQQTFFIIIGLMVQKMLLGGRCMTVY